MGHMAGLLAVPAALAVHLTAERAVLGTHQAWGTTRSMGYGCVLKPGSGAIAEAAATKDLGPSVWPAAGRTKQQSLYLPVDSLAI